MIERADRIVPRAWQWLLRALDPSAMSMRRPGTETDRRTRSGQLGGRASLDALVARGRARRDRERCQASAPRDRGRGQPAYQASTRAFEPGGRVSARTQPRCLAAAASAAQPVLRLQRERPAGTGDGWRSRPSGRAHVDPLPQLVVQLAWIGGPGAGWAARGRVPRGVLDLRRVRIALTPRPASRRTAARCGPGARGWPDYCDAPPATAGRIVISSPSPTGVSRPWPKRMSSPPTYTFTKRRSSPSSVMRSRRPSKRA